MLFLIFPEILNIHWNFFLSCRYQTGFTPPSDKKFEDLSKMDPEPPVASQFGSRVINRMTETISGNKMKKRGGIFGMFAPNKVN